MNCRIAKSGVISILHLISATLESNIVAVASMSPIGSYHVLMVDGVVVKG